MKTKEEYAKIFFDGVNHAIAELQEFRLQIALGKAEARDKFEEIKKKFHASIQTLKMRMNESKTANDIKQKLDELQVQLALGEAEAREAFSSQKEKILKSIHEIEALLKAHEGDTEFYLKLSNELEKFKIKLEILKYKYQPNEENHKKEFEIRIDDFARKMEEIKLSLTDKEKGLGKEIHELKNKLSDTFNHLKKAFTS